MKLTIKGKEYTPKFGIGFMQRAIEAEKPEKENILLVPLIKRIFHSLAYADERQGLEPTLSVFDIYDYVDEVGINHNSLIEFDLEFVKSMRVHIADEETKKALDLEVDKAYKALTPADKKKVSKSGKKTGSKT